MPEAAGPQPAQAGVQAGVMPEPAGLLAGQAGAKAGAWWRAGRRRPATIDDGREGKRGR